MSFCAWLFCFFFNQKTAYDRRISDWSSDVCSSDLFMTWLSALFRLIDPRPPRPETLIEGEITVERSELRSFPSVARLALSLKLSSTETPFQIGRASCRE